MPHLVFRGVSIEQVKTISKPLVEELADVCRCGTDNFTLEVLSSTFIFEKKEVAGFPFIEVKWFERGQEIRDQFAQVVSKLVQSLEIPEVEVAFTTFRETAYYSNGKSFATTYCEK
ncbi:DUF1904 family protein [Bacillus salipaludis]|uniref:DUF1904 family protein n=1 Tax=Bacillus salipaludis TaxID=2547811 RepID=A0ABW8RDE5_9BACI